MSVIAVAPFVLRDVVMTIGTDDYAKHLSTVKFAPAYDTVKWQGLTPDASFTDLSNPTWTCAISYAQDWETEDSLAQYLLENAGQQKVAVFKPKGAATGKPVFTATLTIVPGDIGGDVNTVQTSTVTLGVVGAPVKSVSA
ncbi:hypothetical protein BN12_40055 [Nostocoides japonicum T1-X7]|uniref:Uncharacterized protein n=1 Tax=Nostocoides japonicum T1-X7 TaxID=1194083 RepID=A0A077M4N9_9MICO|nr:hypothetical protein [Tetrasphaera japonica]CCH79085.1 hypothetical protein BN12_40055 [Tetrasphaera japonica T1-X7]